ncbi:MAG: D-TA family PLP-dependent enzyme, partial [Arenibacter sp.]|nr:D-TA family PLP-dependent enzyme [Arenibacter sp.]
MNTPAWFQVENTDDIVTPALLLYPERIEKNIQLMVDMVGNVDRLRPHIKTHKTKEIIDLQMARGIQKFKCATIAEAELLGQCGAKDILLALQPVGANIGRFFELIAQFPNSTFSTIVDNAGIITTISEMASSKKITVPLFIDLNTGMNRTGAAPNQDTADLCQLISKNSNLIFRGIHAYDGHIRNTDIKDRKRVCDAAFDLVSDFKTTLEKKGITVATIVMGGSPTFPIHAQRKDVETSPGTTLLWDERYGTSFPDMKFFHAAVLLTRVISKPSSNVICLDLGHKSIAPEMDFPRVKIFGLEDCEQIGQSEEHLVLSCPSGKTVEVGDLHYAI